MIILSIFPEYRVVLLGVQSKPYVCRGDLLWRGQILLAGDRLAQYIGED